MLKLIVCDLMGGMLFAGKSTLEHETSQTQTKTEAAPTERTVRESGFFERTAERNPFLLVGEWERLDGEEWEQLDAEEPTLVTPQWWAHG
jgi:hypothetical protein